ncbi:MFS transporter [bacterium]|nr:MFS transporter [bacterium]
MSPTNTHTHFRYLGYGCLGGVGWGLGYISPVGALMKWFPDRKGLATGLSLCFFGGGAMIATPVNEFLLSSYSKAPEKLGFAKDLTMFTDEAGRRFAEIAGETVEVVEAVAANAADTIVYATSTGSTGVAETFATMGVAHCAMMMAGALLVRLPHPEASLGKVQDEEEKKQEMMVGVNAQDALKTPQFYLLWGSVFGSAVAGVSVISCAKTMMNECFSSVPLVTSAFCASYVAMLSGANMLGRLGWATASDWTGRKNMYFLFGALGIPTTLAIPTLTTMASEGIGGALPLYAFVGGSVAIVSFYGGLFSVLPAYISDVFGGKHTSGIHGRLLTAWSASALFGPSLMAQLRQRAYVDEMEKLASISDPETFERTFGAPVCEMGKLVEAKSVTIERLMQIAPPGTLDPTPNLYDTTLYSMGGIMFLAMLSNLAIQKIDLKSIDLKK